MSDTAWMDDAACLGMDTELFYPPDGDHGTEAKKVCKVCTVRERCLEYAIEHNEPGIWGGTGSRTRKSLAGAARRIEKPQASTDAARESVCS